MNELTISLTIGVALGYLLLVLASFVEGYAFNKIMFKNYFWVFIPFIVGGITITLVKFFLFNSMNVLVVVISSFFIMRVFLYKAFEDVKMLEKAYKLGEESIQGIYSINKKTGKLENRGRNIDILLNDNAPKNYFPSKRRVIFFKLLAFFLYLTLAYSYTLFILIL